MILLLSVGVSKLRTTGEFDIEWRTLDQIATELKPLTIKSKDVCVRLKVSLEDKVYPKTYYHHNQDDIKVDETPTKI
jgi:hypothetical protein